MNDNSKGNPYNLTLLETVLKSLNPIVKLIDLGVDNSVRNSDHYRIRAVNIACIIGIVSSVILNLIFFLNDQFRAISFLGFIIVFLIPLTLNYFNQVKTARFTLYTLAIIMVIATMIKEPDKILYATVASATIPYFFEKGISRILILFITLISIFFTINYLNIDFSEPSNLRTTIFIVLLIYVTVMIRTITVYILRTIEKNKELIKTLVDQKHAINAQQNQIQQINQKMTQRNEELENFIYIASHDLKEPIRNTINFLQLSKRRLSKKELTANEKQINDLEKNAKQINELITDLLYLSRINVNLEFRQIKLSEFISEAYSKGNYDDSFQLEINNSSIIWSVDIDQFKKLFQIIFNHYRILSKEGGTIKVDITHNNETVKIAIAPKEYSYAQFHETFLNENFRIMDRVNSIIFKKIISNYNGSIIKYNISDDLKSYTIQLTKNKAALN